MGEPGASSSSWRIHEDAMEDEKLRRNVRRRVEFNPSHSVTEMAMVPHTLLEFVVYLPNRSSVEVRVPTETCKKLNVQEFVNLVKMELVKTKTKQSRGIMWGDHVELRDFEGTLICDGEFAASNESKRVLLLYDDHPDTVHAHPGFWNVTPEPHMLEVLPQEYTLFSALADELDNSLQAVYQLQPGLQRLICVDLDHENGKITICDTGKGMDGTPSNCIAKWGTLGSSTNRHVVPEAIGGDPPYLKPNFGMYGFGGISAGFHLGGCITVSSKTETSQRVAILHLGRKSLAANVKSGSVWKTGGEFRSPTELELAWSPHGSFTKVEISDLNWKVSTWRVEEVQRKLKDYYFPYIQNDEGNGVCFTTRPVEIRVNGEDLAGVVGGEVTHTNYHSGPGEPYVIILEFTKPRDMDGPGGRVDKANARITCHYFPVNQGRESIDDIIDQLKEESDFTENFETFSRRAIRRLGRLLPDARGGRLPFMEPKKVFRVNEVNRHCFKRAKAFIDVDAGFIPTQSKMDLVPKHPFTEALLNLGLGLQTVDTARVTLKKAAPVAVTIKRWSTEHRAWASIKPEHLHADYTTWIKKQHDSFDVGAIFDENGVVIVTTPQNKKELNITKDVFRVVYGIKCKDIDWKVGKEKPPIHLKFLRGIPGLNNDKFLFVTVECFISEGWQDDPGDTRIICRPMEIPEDRGSRSGMIEDAQLPYFILGESRAFPLEILFNDKHEIVPEAAWLKELEKIQSKLPSFVDLLNEHEVFELTTSLTEGGNRHSILHCTNLKAGASLPEEIFAVVRPSSCKRPGGSKNEALKLEQKNIIAECMEMTLMVRGLKDGAEKLYQARTIACTKNNWRGVYCFSTTDLESVTRTTGTYEFKFTLVSAKFKEVEDFKLHINVTPSTVVGGWKICDHSGICSENHPNRNPEVMNIRLGEMLPTALYLSRVDEFNNPMEFTTVPANIKAGIFSLDGEQLFACAVDDDLIQIADEDHYSLQIARIEVGGGDFAPLKPTMGAYLRMSISDSVVANFSVSVLPGEMASALLKESEESRLVYETMKSKLQKLEKKARSYEKECKRLSNVKKDHNDSMKRYAEECDALAVRLEHDDVREEPHDPIEIFALTPAQVALKVTELGHPPGTHAAAILVQAQTEHYTEIVEENGILGPVALLGAVEGEQLNRALVEFLGIENMLAIICSTESAAECMGIPPSAPKNKGLFGYMRRQNLRISGRYRVIALTDESRFYKCPNGSRAVNETHPQRLLNIGPVIKEGAESSVGSLGYAVNLIHLTEEQLKIRIGGLGLRESLFFMLFGFLEVFDTKENMFKARKNLRSGTAVSLDGGLIRAPNQFELGSREDPVVWFPAVDAAKQRLREAAARRSQKSKSKPVNVDLQRYEAVKEKMEIAQVRYTQAGIEDDLRKVTDKKKSIEKQMNALTLQLNGASPGAVPVSPLAPRPPGSKY